MARKGRPDSQIAGAGAQSLLDLGLKSLLEGKKFGSCPDDSEARSRFGNFPYY